MFLKKIHIFEKKETLVLTFLKSKRIIKIVVEIIATKKGSEMLTYSINIQLIKQKRLEHKYTLQEMSEALGLANRSLYLKRENGYQKFKANELPLLSKKLGIPLNDFFIPNVEKNSKGEK